MDETEPCCGDLLREVARLYVRAQRFAADCCGTTVTQCHMLVELHRSGAIPMNELGARLSLEKSWVSRAVDSLVREGLVSKTTHPQDARSWLLRLTPAGRRRCEALNAQLDGHAERLMDRFDRAEQDTVNRGLALVLRALREEAGIRAHRSIASPEGGTP
jgi:DNA-binding MarR family transcriptional regulator